MKLILTRHGQTFANEKNLYEGFGNSKLNVIGTQQAKSVGKLLKDFSITKVYASPRIRCIQTLEAIKDENISINNDNIEYLEALAETNFGLWEGKDYRTISKEFAKLWNDFIEDYSSFTFPQGESTKEFYDRCTKAIKYIIKTSNKEDTVLVVAHSGVIRVILCYLLDIGQKGFYYIKPKQGAYSSINIYDKTLEIEYINKDY
jgi:broad specificity phosphatase PhoE